MSQIQLVAILLVVSFGLLGCEPERVPVVATYEPVDCSCPPTMPDEPPVESISGAETEEVGDVADEAPPGPEAASDAGREVESVEPQAASRASNGERASVPKSTVAPAPPAALEPRVDLNSASLAELQSLPRIGPSKAQRIVDYREKRWFRNPSELMRIKGIGPATFRKLKGRVVVRPGSPKKRSNTSSMLR